VDLAAGLTATVLAPSPEAIVSRIKALVGGPSGVWVGLSVRTAFDLLLQALDLPPGSEILVSAVTTRDMVHILEHHGLVPVPLDLDLDTLAPVVEVMERAVTPSSRGIVAAHLFGARTDLEEVVRFARRHRLVLIEDCAQASAGPTFTGHPGATASMLSFGPIKTSTALGGGIALVRDPLLLDRMQQIEARYPRRSRRGFAVRVLRYAALKFLTIPTVYGGFLWLVRASGRDPDSVVNRSARGFPGAQLVEQIRHRAPVNLLALLERRLRRFDPGAVERQLRCAEHVAARLPRGIARPGSACTSHGYWLFPILVDDAEGVARRLRAGGVDATCAPGSLAVVEPPPDRPELAARTSREALRRLVYLPVYPDIPPSALARLVRDLEAAVDAPRPQGREEPQALGTG
jgi:dTDP-4-amino-4,6-dideoxygalactose transaminase